MQNMEYLDRLRNIAESLEKRIAEGKMHLGQGKAKPIDADTTDEALTLRGLAAYQHGLSLIYTGFPELDQQGYQMNSEHHFLLDFPIQDLGTLLVVNGVKIPITNQSLTKDQMIDLFMQYKRGRKISEIACDTCISITTIKRYLVRTNIYPQINPEQSKIQVTKESTIEELALRKCVERSLKFNGINTIADLCETNEIQLRCYPGVGIETLKYIKAVLANNKLSLADF